MQSIVTSSSNAPENRDTSALLALYLYSPCWQPSE